MSWTTITVSMTNGANDVVDYITAQMTTTRMCINNEH